MLPLRRKLPLEVLTSFQPTGHRSHFIASHVTVLYANTEIRKPVGKITP
jgi:hypothetical protein